MPSMILQLKGNSGSGRVAIGIEHTFNAYLTTLSRIESELPYKKMDEGEGNGG